MSAQGVRQVAWFDCPGGGQVVVDGRVACIAHMKAPHGTTLVDVSDPRSPRQLAQLEVPPGTHSHKVRAVNGLMLVNREGHGAQAAAGAGGLGIWDISKPGAPREITFWRSGGLGVHRFTFDGRYAYLSPEMDGYVGNIVMILDLADPARPQEVGRWWMPGQWTAGGETPTWKGRQHRCHHPIRQGNRLYVSYWHGGFVILDIEDMGKPRHVSGLDWSPPFITPTHTAVPVPFPLQGRRVLVVADEDVAKLEPGPPSFLWLVDISDERRPVPFASFQVAGVDGSPQPEFTGCHQPVETITSTEIPTAWFAYGLRVVDIAQPHAPREVAHFLPEPPPGEKRVCSNDVFVDDRGLIYLIDRGRCRTSSSGCRRDLLLILKLVLVPGLVAGATLGGRRWGPAMGGWLTAFPLVAGPALFFLAMEQGEAFAARAALGALVGLIGVAAFGVAYGWTALRLGWAPSVLAGWGAFALVTVLSQAVRWTPLAAIACTLAAFALVVRLLPAERGRPAPAVPPAWDLPLRMVGALAVVLTVTSIAERLGPALSGALAPFPIAISVVTVFTHAQQGVPAVLRLLRGFYPAMWGMGLFCLVVALALVPLGAWLGFLAALAVQVAVHGLVLWRMLRVG